MMRYTRKKTAVILLAAMLLTLCVPAAAAADTYSVNIPESSTGYVVTLREPEKDGVRLMSAIGLEEISSENGVYFAESAEEVKALGARVESCEANGTVKLLASTNDKYAQRQWNLDSIGIESAWEKGYEGEGVRIAVIDSGIRTTHEDFENTDIAVGLNTVNGGTDVSDESGEGHGTFIAGVIAATRNNGKGIAGLLSGVTIVPIKCFGSDEETGVANVLKGIYAAVDDLDCDVINLSLGMTADILVMRQAMEYASSRGVIIVSAVGNSGTEQLNYPAAYPSVVGVGSYNEAGRVESFSQKNKSVYVVAPGDGIISSGGSSNTAYYDGAGTSFSCPHVAAAAAIVKQYRPDADYEDFMALLSMSCVDLGQNGYDSESGYGALNIANMIEVMEDYFQNVPVVRYSDIVGHWAEEDINYCVENGYFTGVSENKFAPNDTTSRAMYVTVLSRMSGEEISGYANIFSDVDNGSWYEQPCAWGAQNAIVSGTGDGMFQPTQDVTREQMAAFIYRYARYEGLVGDAVNTDVLDIYADGGQVSDWAREAMAWCLDRGIITGRAGIGLCPEGTATRAETATVMARYDKYILYDEG